MIHHNLFVLLIITLLLIPSNCYKCSVSCNCLWTEGKSAANCTNLGLTRIERFTEDGTGPIQVIFLGGNKFTELKRHTFLNANLVNLQKIYMQKVGLEFIDEHAFEKLQNLVELDLSQNSLRDIPMMSFAAIPKLRKLVLNGNKLSSILNDAFADLLQLQTLSLTNNRLQHIDDDAFNGLSNLQTLKLNDNQIAILGRNVFIPLIKLNVLRLSGNKWNCDCKMRPLREFFLTKTNINIDKPKCVNKNQKIWTELAIDEFLCAPKLVNLSQSIVEVEEGTTLGMECAVVLDDGVNPDVTTIEWHWKSTALTNNSKGCGGECFEGKEQQKFIIRENITFNQMYPQNKLKLSKLELSNVLSLNEGSYMCSARNSMGYAKNNFTVKVGPRSYGSINRISTESHIKNDDENKSENPDTTVIALILGILFGIFIILVLFGISVIVLCRRRRQKLNRTVSPLHHIAFDNEFETEKLTHQNSSNILGPIVVNPVQKPPRLGVTSLNQNELLYELKPMNGNIIDGDGYAPLHSFESNEFIDSDNSVEQSLLEPNSVHLSAYVRSTVPPEEMDKLSVHSDGTEV